MKTYFILSFTIVMLLLQGCSKKELVVEQPTLMFPSPPNEPRILYLETYRGEKKEDKSSSSGGMNALDIFLGETAEKKNAATSMIVKPYGVASGNGKIYVVDTGSKFVFAIDEKTRDVLHIGIEGVGKLAGPVSVALDANGTLYVSDMNKKAILAYNQKGKFQFAIGDRLEFVHPTGIAIDKKLNRLYVADTKAHKFKAFDLKSKKLLFEVGSRGAEEGQFNFLTNIAVDSRNNNIIVVDTQNFRVQVFDKDGKFIRKFGKVGDRAGEFARPKGIAVDTEGHIYVADSAFNNVQIFNEDGALMLYFGSAGYADPGTFRLISGISIDENDKMVISDGFSGRVQTFQYLSDKWKQNNQKKYKELKELKPVEKIDKETDEEKIKQEEKK